MAIPCRIAAGWISLFLMFILAPQMLAQQRVISGSVSDAESGFPLAGAHIQLEGSDLGTVTNREGNFRFAIPDTTVTLLIRFIGYETREVAVPPGLTIANIRLNPATVLMDELVVSGEDPAVGIMRKVIARKQEWRTGLDRTETQVFSRFVLEGPDGIVQMTESLNDRFWKKEGGVREVIRAKRYIPERGSDYRFADMIAVPDFYDDFVTINQTDYIGPTHPDAIDVYSFRIGTRRIVDGDEWVEIYLTPRTGFSTALLGRLQVRLRDYIMLEAFLRPDYFPVSPPIRTWEESYRQQFADLGRDQWYPVDFYREGFVDIGVPGARYPRASYRQTSVLSALRVNEGVPDSLFSQKEQIIEEEYADLRSERFYRTTDLLPMTDLELSFFLLPGNGESFNAIFRPEGLLSGYARIDLDEKTASPVKEWYRYRGKPATGYNRVDGLRIGYKKPLEWRDGSRVDVLLGVDYSSSRFRYDLVSTLPVPRLTSVSLRAGVHRGTRARFDETVYPEVVTGISGFLGYPDYHDYLLARGYSLGLEWRPRGRASWSVQGGIFADKHQSVRKSSDYEGFLVGEGQRENPAVNDGHAGGFAIQAGTIARSVLSPFQWKLEIDRAEKGKLGSDFTFWLFSSKITWELETFFRRENAANRLRIQIVGRHLAGEPPVQLLSGMDTGLAFGFSTFGAFGTRRNEPYSGSSILSVFWEHDFRSQPFTWLGFWGLADRGTSLLLFGGHGKTWLLSSLRESPLADTLRYGNLHHEIGLGLKNILGYPVVARAGYRLDDPGWFASLSFSRTWP